MRTRAEEKRGRRARRKSPTRGIFPEEGEDFKIRGRARKGVQNTKKDMGGVPLAVASDP